MFREYIRLNDDGSVSKITKYKNGNFSFKKTVTTYDDEGESPSCEKFNCDIKNNPYKDFLRDNIKDDDEDDDTYIVKKELYVSDKLRKYKGDHRVVELVVNDLYNLYKDIEEFGVDFVYNNEWLDEKVPEEEKPVEEKKKVPPKTKKTTTATSSVKSGLKKKPKLKKTEE